jgi:solute carrier family 35 protein E1
MLLLLLLPGAAARYVWASLLPIVGGCSLSAMKEVSFSWGGFNNAMISNLGMVLRNIYSKKSLNDYKVSVSNSIYIMSAFHPAHGGSALT